MRIIIIIHVILCVLIISHWFGSVCRWYGCSCGCGCGCGCLCCWTQMCSLVCSAQNTHTHRNNECASISPILTIYICRFLCFLSSYVAVSVSNGFENGNFENGNQSIIYRERASKRGGPQFFVGSRASCSCGTKTEGFIFGFERCVLFKWHAALQANEQATAYLWAAFN